MLLCKVQEMFHKRSIWKWQERARCAHAATALRVALSLADSIDDEQEQYTIRHRPEALEQLEAQTQFTKKELQILYRGFKNVRVPSFISLSAIFPHNDPSLTPVKPWLPSGDH